MKRLTLLCLTRDRDEALHELRALGVVHITDRRPPTGADLDTLRERLAGSERALRALTSRDVDSGSDESAALDPEDTVEEVLALLERRDQLAARSDELGGELARYDPFGEFDLEEVRALERAGVWTALAVAPLDARLEAPAGVLLTQLGSGTHERHLLLTASGARPESPPDLGGDYELVPWPSRPLTATRAELHRLSAEADEAERRLDELAAARDAVVGLARTRAAQTRFAEVRAGMDEVGEVSVLSGYVPADELDVVREAAAQNGWGLVLDDPTPGENVPVQLRQAGWVKPIRTVFDFLQIYPGYWEADVGWVMLPFFSLFFAMIVGDAGYALLLLVLTAVLRWKVRGIPAHVFHMMYIVAGATLIWGVINGSYFGVPVLPPPLESLTVPWISERDNLIDFCFFIGAVHLTFAHAWNAVALIRSGRRLRVLAQVGWLLVVWSMFFIARQTVLDRGAPGFLLVMLVLGILLIAVFMKTAREFRENWIDHALLPLTMVGNFVDILSYIRLFAVGYASIAVLAAFNDMAAGIGFGSPLNAIAASLLLLFANALNIVLVGLGVLVHAVRLNTLEFSTHKGLAWEGHNLYSPFAADGPAAR